MPKKKTALKRKRIPNTPKLTAAAKQRIQTIKNLRKKGVSFAVIGARFEVSRQRVHQILKLSSKGV